MNTRPELNKEMSSEVFKSYYYLKEELVTFLRNEGLQTSGSKIELTERISLYLETGQKENLKKKEARSVVKKKMTLEEITEESIIETPFVCSEVHRAFFKAAIGKSFSFNVAFQKWLKENSGRTYREAIEAYKQILEEKKKKRGAIAPQFEYNTYIRAFFEANKDKTLEEAIKCWKYKKSLPGSNQYEKQDLIALDED